MKTKLFGGGVLVILSAVLMFFLFSDGIDRKKDVTIEDSEQIDEFKNIKASDYFPRIVTRNQYTSPNGDGTNMTVLEIAKYGVGLNNREERMIESISYQGNVELGRAVEHYSVTEKSIKNQDGLEIFKTKPRWTSNNTEFHISEYLKTYTVPAGSFDNCIEVTRVDIPTQLTVRMVHAPGVGIIRMTSQSQGKEEELIAELVSTSTTLYGESDNQEKEDVDELDEIIKEDSENSSLQPVGNLPERNDKVSNLTLSDYDQRVNDLHLKQFDYILLHRPEFKENDTEFTITYTDGISIITNKEGFIKEVEYSQEEPMIEEDLYNIQHLIMGLDDEITMEEANEILFADEPIIYSVGAFNLAINKSKNGFTFLAVTK
ncbi:hypothetical protein M3172_04845 [Mesobacillus subterraneus]|uniref:hypothetical protein n=1 Tax=Mesobacillus subterraneus TaxID=285983 RepID=UPI002040CC1B|nr:hypothetical protein [Mesobacillus subterraneus]MCM3572506.1 hypothetical protein [Mesobacillus subterraneus]